jgi:hypothetical protein
MKLHRIHAAPSKGWSVDIAGIRWRPENGGSAEMKRAQAHRIALTWNLAEGFPTEALERGCLRDVNVAVHALLAAEEAGQPLAEHFAELRSALEAQQLDETDGRLHDCEQCLSRYEEEGASQRWSAQAAPTAIDVQAPLLQADLFG